MTDPAYGGQDSRVPSTDFVLASDSGAAATSTETSRSSVGPLESRRPSAPLKAWVGLGALGWGGGWALPRQGRRRRKPEGDEERGGLNRDPDIALEPLHLPRQPIESPRKRRFLPFGRIGG